ncbi:phosphoribulokinase [Streptococcus pluranimalium]|uniref:phosphoribulokinase n=1 Tax=Streptococcus pluranimalium TaxID=82348 RepID=UPI002A7AD8A0|nr:phosphoribulokinase [Streptococcus pluranimalium]
MRYLLCEKTSTIRIVGYGASGKSSLAKDLADVLGNHVNLLETDPYISSSEYRKLVVPKALPDQKIIASIPIIHDLKSLERDILGLQQGVSILTIHEPWSPSKILYGDKPILIVEGMSAAFLPQSLFDVTLACYTDSQTELNRRLDRDTKVRQRNSEFVKKTYEIRHQQYHHYLEPIIKNADILIDQSTNDFKVTYQSSYLKGLK